MKKTFKIPDGCKEITIEKVGNQLVTTFEPELKEPLDGVVYFLPRNDKLGFIESISIFKNGKRVVNWLPEVDNDNPEEFPYEIDYFSLYRVATNSEKQMLFDYLSKQGKKWNAEKLCIENLKWTPKFGEVYFSLGSVFEENWYNDHIDRYRLENNLIFRTEKERDAALLKFNSINK